MKGTNSMSLLPVIARYREHYLERSERFIFDLSSNLKHHTNLLLTKWTKNLNIFPLPHIYAPLPRYHMRWWYDRLAKYVLCYPEAYFEYILRKYDAKLIHAHFGYDALHMLPLKKRMSLPLITSFHGYDYLYFPTLIGNPKIYEELFELGDLFLVEGYASRKELITLGCPPEKIRIQRLGVNLERMRFSHRTLTSSHEIIRILFAGRLTEKKGIMDALHVFDRIHQKFPNTCFTIVGDGELRVQIDDYINAKRLQQHVNLLGMLSFENLLEQMDLAHIFFHPSVKSQDGNIEAGIPAVILQAEAKGLPVLSTYHTDIPEGVIDGKSGFLSQEHDIDDLAEKLEHLLLAPEIWPEMGECGRAHIKQHFDLKNNVAQLEEYYMSLY